MILPRSRFFDQCSILLCGVIQLHDCFIDLLNTRALP
jgi:hypothetical protein